MGGECIVYGTRWWAPGGSGCRIRTRFDVPHSFPHTQLSAPHTITPAIFRYLLKHMIKGGIVNQFHHVSVVKTRLVSSTSINSRDQTF